MRMKTFVRLREAYNLIQVERIIKKMMKRKRENAVIRKRLAVYGRTQTSPVYRIAKAA